MKLRNMYAWRANFVLFVKRFRRNVFIPSEKFCYNKNDILPVIFKNLKFWKTNFFFFNLIF